MLRKLLKYDLRNIYKILSVFYMISVFFSILTRIFFSFENSFIINIIGQICSGVVISMIFNIVINNLIRLWVRFSQSLYGDESYLTHTLPIDKRTLYFSKMISAGVTLLTSVAVIAVSLFTAYCSKENFETLKKILIPISNALDSSVIVVVSVLFIVLFLEFANALQCGYTGMIIGHRMDNYKIGYSILFGFISFIVSQIFVLLVIFVVALFNSDMMNLFLTRNAINIETLKIIGYISIAAYSLLLIAGCFINFKLFRRGVNVD